MPSKKKRKQNYEAYGDALREAAKLGIDTEQFKGDNKYKARTDKILAAIRDARGPESEAEAEETVDETVNPMDVNQSVTTAIGGVVPAVAQDTAAGLGFRQDIRDLLGPEIAAAGEEGLTDQDLADIAAVREQRMSDVTSDFRSRVQNVVGGLKGRGFMSSNLAGRAMDSGAFRALDRNMQGVQAQESQMRQGILNARAGRRAQRIGSALSAANVLGSSGVGQLQGSYINPNIYGGISQRDAAQILPGIAQTGGSYWSDPGRMGASIATQPRMISY